MAGIGFELKKIYRKEGISRALIGAGYSSLVTVGPTLLVIGVILFLYLILGMSKVGYAQRELLSTTMLYIFIFSGVLTSPFNSLFSRYLADKFYQKEYDNILPSYYVGAAIVGACTFVMAAPVLLSMYFRGGVDLPFLLGAYVMWVSVSLLFFTITYLHATKDYKIVTLFFGIGMALGGIVSWLLSHTGLCDVVHAILYGMTVGFFLIAFSQFSYVRRYFSGKGQDYTECLRYFGRHWKLFGTNLFYVLGLYVHNFVFWTTSMRLEVAKTLVCCPSYDMAVCLAMFTNISTTVLFTILAETQFHDAYQDYMQSVIGAAYNKIQLQKRALFRTLSQQMIHVFAIQIAITSVLFLVVILAGRNFFSAATMEIYPVLAVSFLGIFMMYDNIVYLYYYEDATGTLLTSVLFFAGTFVFTLLSRHFSAPYYGIGVFLGMLVGWTFSFFRIRWVERNIEGLIYCRYKLVATMKSSVKGETVYKKA